MKCRKVCFLKQNISFAFFWCRVEVWPGHVFVSFTRTQPHKAGRTFDPLFEVWRYDIYCQLNLIQLSIWSAPAVISNLRLRWCNLFVNDGARPVSHANPESSAENKSPRRPLPSRSKANFCLTQISQFKERSLPISFSPALDAKPSLTFLSKAALHLSRSFSGVSPSNSSRFKGGNLTGGGHNSTSARSFPSAPEIKKRETQKEKARKALSPTHFP